MLHLLHSTASQIYWSAGCRERDQTRLRGIHDDIACNGTNLIGPDQGACRGRGVCCEVLYQPSDVTMSGHQCIVLARTCHIRHDSVSPVASGPFAIRSSPSLGSAYHRARRSGANNSGRWTRRRGFVAYTTTCGFSRNVVVENDIRLTCVHVTCNELDPKFGCAPVTYHRHASRERAIDSDAVPAFLRSG